jgi:hypothetical protein
VSEEQTMGPTTHDREMSAAAQARARDGFEHLQAAARELIAAARAALDVAEEVVNDPESLATLAGTIATVGDVVRRVTGTGGWPSRGAATGCRGEHGGDVDGDEAPRVERITVT